jgi:hypothetical protein
MTVSFGAEVFADLWAVSEWVVKKTNYFPTKNLLPQQKKSSTKSLFDVLHCQ